MLAVLRLMVNPTESLICVLVGQFITSCRKENSLLACDLLLVFFRQRVMFWLASDSEKYFAQVDWGESRESSPLYLLIKSTYITYSYIHILLPPLISSKLQNRVESSSGLIIFQLILLCRIVCAAFSDSDLFFIHRHE